MNFYFLSPMDQNHPKKRGGRKKKVTAAISDESEGASITLPKEEKKRELTQEQKDQKERMAKITKELEISTRKLDELLKPERLAGLLNKKVLKQIRGAKEKRAETLDSKNRLIYDRIKEGVASKQDIIEWQDRISGEMAKKICKVINFLLENGPLSTIDRSILGSCTNALESYYEERSYLISVDSQIYSSSTYYPVKDSGIYKYLIEIVKIPELNNLVEFHKNK
jgi:hypothetical protein